MHLLLPNYNMVGHTDAPYHNSKTDEKCVETGCRDLKINHINSNSSSSIESVAKAPHPVNLDPYRGQCRYGTHSIAPKNRFYTLSWWSIDNAQFCRFCLVSSNRTTNVQPYYLSSTLFSLFSAEGTSLLLQDTHADTPIVLSHTVNTEILIKLKTQRSINAYNTHPSTQTQTSPPNTYGNKASVTPPPAEK